MSRIKDTENSVKSYLRDGREQGWWWISNEALDEYLPKVGTSAWAVYCYIVRRANKNDQCWPSIATIARDCGVSRGTVKQSIVRLEEHGLIHIEARVDDSGDAATHLYTILEGRSKSDPPRTKSDRQVGQILTHGVGQNLTPNNTQSFNNTQREEKRFSDAERWFGAALTQSLPTSLSALRECRPDSLVDGVLTLHPGNGHVRTVLAKRLDFAAQVLSKTIPGLNQVKMT